MSNVTAEQYAAVQQELEKTACLQFPTEASQTLPHRGARGKDILGALTTAGCRRISPFSRLLES